MADRYRATLTSVLDKAWREDALLAEVDRLEAILTPSLGGRQAGAARAMQAVRDYIARRRGELLNAFDSWPAAAPETWRRPMTSQPLGTASGSFVATYREGAVDEVPPPEVAIELTLDGQRIGVDGVDASVSTFMFPGFGGGRPAPNRPTGDPADAPATGEQPISVVISGKRADDGKPIAFNLFLDRRRVRDSDEPVPVNGMVTEGISGFGIPGLSPMRTIDGTFVPVDRGIAPGEKLGGRFELTLTQMRGGLMTTAPMKKPAAAETGAPSPP